ncbi:hypothetical protein BV98_001463 [Sphingobium herbicidovorans NBRC 16415]|uniref:Uncharacterized protein n=1 Tax=Sphingobium herbicidovorans (strain ATCC 700291 / DSM 11019 / CCUG 56400 / KCTC 2939 / LMG 18315 / NBRC 16415 / MH) TaxID=1219045 RepID=A0A086PBI3_SPHHM|nr:hypothetical protein [Sphingobium herbicidovorans]KFG90751.1 hypothetical protein BV98_001463 [Sphingobium herbicidovorans NBRC 16415]
MIIAESMLDKWLREAKAGETIVYARATFLTPNKVTRRLYELAQTGHVELKRSRRQHGPGDENLHYIAKRLGKPLPGSSPAKGGTRIVKGILPLPAKPQDRRYTSHASVVREIEPQVRELLAEGHARSAARLARTLGLYSHNPVVRVLERLAA